MSARLVCDLCHKNVTFPYFQRGQNPAIRQVDVDYYNDSGGFTEKVNVLIRVVGTGESADGWPTDLCGDCVDAIVLKALAKEPA